MLNGNYTKKVLWITIYFSFFLSLVWLCICQCHYYIYGDSVVYFNDLSKLHCGYWHINLNAFLGRIPNYLPLTTEGGFTFFLYLASLLHWEFPFFVATLFCIAFLFVLSLLVKNLSSSKSTSTFSGILIIAIILLIPQVAYSTLGLSASLRDSTAHFWGFLGLLFCCLGIKAEPNKRKLAFGGFCIGIACWCRVPNLLFIVPAGVYVLSFAKKIKFKQTFNALLLMFVGLVLGILPLICQNIYEGRPFYSSGQFDSLVARNSSSGDEESDNSLVNDEYDEKYSVDRKDEDQNEIVKLLEKKYNPATVVTKGVSLNNFLYIFISLIKQIYRTLGSPILLTLLVCIIIGCFTNYKAMLCFFSGAVVFFMFYSCYDKTVPRYTLIVYYFLLPIIAIVLADVGNFLCRKTKFKKNIDLIFCIISISLFFVVLNRLKPWNWNIDNLRAERTYIVKLREATDGVFHKGDSYICFDPILSTSLHYLTGAIPIPWHLSVGSWYRLREQEKYLAYLDNKLESGNVFYCEKYSDIKPYKYWSKKNINLHYELNKKEDIFPMFSLSEGLLISQIVKKDYRPRSVDCVKTVENPSSLMIWTANASKDVLDEQSVVFTTEHSCFTNTLISGINLYSLPRGFLLESSSLTLSSLTSSCLPIIIEAKAFSTNVVFECNEYEKLAASTITVQGSNPFWHDRKDYWKREYRHHKLEYINPLVALSVYTEIPIYSDIPLKMSVRINTLGLIGSQKILENINNIKIFVNEDSMTYNREVVKYNSKKNKRFILADLTIEENIFVNKFSKIAIDLSEADEIAIFLDSIRFFIEEEE